MKLFKVATLQKLRHLQPCNVPFSGSDKVWTGLQGRPFQRVRVSGGHLCEAEAPTEAAAETLAKPQVLTEGL